MFQSMGFKIIINYDINKTLIEYDFKVLKQRQKKLNIVEQTQARKRAASNNNKQIFLLCIKVVN